MTVSIFSYHDGVTIGLLTDAGLVPDPQAIVARAQVELQALAGLAPATPPRTPSDSPGRMWQ
jgi:WS/DGAT C-terminal domain